MTNQPITKLSVPAQGKTGFTLIDPARSGIHFTNLLPEIRQMTNANLMNGSGVALGDFDGDGWCDIYFTSLAGANVLYKNLGNWTFRDVTATAGVACAGQTATGAVFADLDGDGDLDLLVTSMGGPNACLINDGNGHFTDKTVEAGLVSKLGSTSMALADIDLNGTLDLYVCNYGVSSIMRSGGTFAVSKNAKGEPVVAGRNSKRMKIIDGVLYELGEPHMLYLNDGKANFKAVAWNEAFFDEQGQPVAEAPWDQGLSVIFRDLNEDGSPDIFVCNDASMPDRIWFNDGHGKFHAAPFSAIRKTSYFCMGVDVADFDRDGHDDIFTVDMLSRIHGKRMIQQSVMHPQPNIPGEIAAPFQARRNVLLLGDGRGNFTEIGNYSGVAASDWTWSCIFMDVDLDGWEDVLVTNGFEHDVDDQDVRDEIAKLGKLSLGANRRTLLKFPKLSTPNYAFRNRRDLSFEEVGEQWGFNSSAISNGMALADLDNDGDLDVVVNCMNSSALVYRNDSAAPRVAVRLEGRAPNTQGIGARITVTGGPAAQSQVIMAGGRYVSGDQAERVFAAGTPTNLVSVRVDWPSGARSELSNVPANSRCVINESTGQKLAKTGKPNAPAPWFKDVSSHLNHRHQQLDYNDFARQPSLPHKLGQTGPPIAIADVTGDGFDDVIIGAGKGGRGAVFSNDHGKFQNQTPSVWDNPARNNDVAIVAFKRDQGTTLVIRAECNYEQGGDSAVFIYEVSKNEWRPTQTLRVPIATISSLAVADVDGNNTLDLFVGGRCIPGEYPRAASSYLYRSDGKMFEMDEAASKRFQNIGLVTGALWSDLNSDGFPDLILSLEWSTIRIYQNNKGALEELATPSKAGLWTFVTTGDLNSDGLPDILAGNWGLNSIYASRLTEQLALYHGDLNENGHEAMLLAHKQNDTYVPFRDLSVNSTMFSWMAFPSHAAYSRLTVEQVLGSHLQKAQRLQTDSLETTLFVNRRDHFEKISLPAAVQFSPAMGATICDFDADGFEDIYVAQNFFGVRPGDERLDAGGGLLLRGNASGEFTSVPPRVSGISILGQESSPASADFNRDGKLDLLVGQNSALTQLLQNDKAGKTVRVQLIGPSGNRDAIGATIRLGRGDHFGPAREVRCASGPIAQESSVQHFAAANAPSSARVLWPGGKRLDYLLPTNATSIVIDVEKGVMPAADR